MREFLNQNNRNKELIERSLQTIASVESRTDEYRTAFFNLGEELGLSIKERYRNLGNTMVACLNEDADWLTKGLIGKLEGYKISLAVYWSERVKFSVKPNIEYAPIIYAYEEPIDNCESLVIVKSIISTSCVVKTQLARLVGRIKPTNIIIAAPVMFKGSDKNLYDSFAKTIADKMEFITFALDDERDPEGVVIPGIGGWVFRRLGLGNTIAEVNKFIPELVKNKILSTE